MRLVLAALLGLVAIAAASHYDYPFLYRGHFCPRDREWSSFRVRYHEYFEDESAFFKLECPDGRGRERCEWYHEEWRIPRFYMRDTEVQDDGHLRLRRSTDNSGTWRVRYGNYWTTYHVAVRPSGYTDFRDDFPARDDSREDHEWRRYDNATFEGRTFENRYFYNRIVRRSHFRDVYFRNVHFHYVRFEDVTFENVRWEWTRTLYFRAEFVNCRFINTQWMGARIRHSFWSRSHFEGGRRYDGADERYRDRDHTFVDLDMYDTIFCNVDWRDAFWYRFRAHNVTFSSNRWWRFEAYETRFYSFYEMRMPCREVMFGDYVYDYEDLDRDRCWARVYRRGADWRFNFDFFRYDDREDERWHPSVRFWNNRFEDFTFRRANWRAVEWFSTYFDRGYFYGERDWDFSDMHFAACRFTDTRFSDFRFRRFMYFTACHFDRFQFERMYGERMYFHGCRHHYFDMSFTESRFMYFDHCFWRHGYMRGFYDRFRFENSAYRWVSWEVDRVKRYEYCHAYYYDFTVRDANIDEYENRCNDREREWLHEFCRNHPYHYWCMQYRRFFWLYQCREDMHRCDWETHTWWWRWHWYPQEYRRYELEDRRHRWDDWDRRWDDWRSRSWDEWDRRWDSDSQYFEGERSWDNRWDEIERSDWWGWDWRWRWGDWDWRRGDWRTSWNDRRWWFDTWSCRRDMERFDYEPEYVMFDFRWRDNRMDRFHERDYTRYYTRWLRRYDDTYWTASRRFDRWYFRWERYWRCYWR